MEATKDSLNSTFITFQTIGLVLYMAEWLSENVIFLMNFLSVELGEYQTVKNAVIVNTGGTVANCYSMCIVAIVIYKSSRLVGLQRDPILKLDVSLLTYLRN